MEFEARAGLTEQSFPTFHSGVGRMAPRPVNLEPRQCICQYQVLFFRLGWLEGDEHPRAMQNTAPPVTGPARFVTPSHASRGAPAWARWGFTAFMALRVPNQLHVQRGAPAVSARFLTLPPLVPFLLSFLVRKLGYDRRAFVAWTALAWALCLVAFFLLPPAGAHLANPNTPVNVNYVFGMNDAEPQHWIAPGLYLAVWMTGLLAIFYLPTHCILRWFGRRQIAASANPQQP